MSSSPLTVPAASTAVDEQHLSDALAMDAVTLRVGDLELMSSYYENALALQPIEEQTRVGGEVHRVLGRGQVPFVRLVATPGLPAVDPRQAGLFHTAFLFEDQAALAGTVLRAAQDPRSRFVGTGDHLVSEAFYFADPEGNGIELYWDRPRESWSWTNGEVAMDTTYLDPNVFLNEHLNGQAIAGQRSAEAEIGHVHLQVGDVDTARSFYVNTLGFDETTALGDQALFVSAGGYHHHMAMNVWNSRGAGPRKDTLGLGEVLINVPTADEVGKLAQRLDFAKVANHHTGAELRFMDPWNNQLRVAVS